MPSRVPRGLPADNPTDPDSVRHILFRTLPGRALVAGGAIRLLASLVQLAIGRSPAIDAVGTVGTLTLLAAIGYFAWRFIARAKRQLLWRVRRKLILSYIFVGLVPVLLAIIFFALCGVLLFMSISSYVVQTRLRSVTEQAQFLARSVAMDVSQGLSAGDLEDRLERKQHAFSTRFPDALAGGRSRSPDLRVRRARSAGAGSAAAPRWPDRGRTWRRSKSCLGGSDAEDSPGLMAYWVGSPEALDKTLEALATPPPGTGNESGRRGASVRRGCSSAPWRCPKDRRRHSRWCSTCPSTSWSPSAFRKRPASNSAASACSAVTSRRSPSWDGGRRSLRHRAASAVTSSRGQPNWVVLLAYTDWRTGRTGTVTQSFGMRIGEIYDRLLPSNMPNGLTFGQMLMAFIVVVGLLFLVIQFVALVMGLALARSITGSVHELFVGTERVRQGDFTHQIQVRARDQLGELADSFNNMTGRLGQLLAEMTEKKRLEEELRIARNMQMSLLPQRPPVQLPGITLTALCAPAREVGGDYYDFLPLEGNRLGLLIADVSGKGASAAFYMAELKGLVLSLCEIHRSPRDLLIAADQP